MTAPYYYDYINAKTSIVTPSTVHVSNTGLARFFHRALMERAMSVYKWNVPDNWDLDYFRAVLYYWGYAAVIKTDLFGVIPQECGLGGYNVYLRPRYVLINNPLIRQPAREIVIDRDCALIKLRSDYRGLHDFVTYYGNLLALIAEVAENPDVCRTLVIDTADWAEAMAIQHICTKFNQPGLEAFGYGKGYTYLSEEFARFLATCDKVIRAGMNVVITAHARQRRIELPDEMGGFDCWGLKLTKQCAPLLKEWPDALLFLNYKTIVVTVENTKKAQGGKRMIFTNHRPTYDAKNRHGLVDELPLEYASIAPIFVGTKPEASEVPKAEELPLVEPETLQVLHSWMDEAGIAPEQLQALVAKKGQFPYDMPIEKYPERFVRGWVMKHWEKIILTIRHNAEQ